METQTKKALGTIGKAFTNVSASMPGSKTKAVSFDDEEKEPTGTDAKKAVDSIGSTASTDQATASTQKKQASTQTEQATPEVQEQATAAASDERMKDVASRLNLTDTFAKINSYLYKYKPQIQKEYGNTKHVDGEPHVGVLAQELEANPVTQSTVKTDENGFKNVDTAQLALTLAAVVSDMAKEIKDLKNKIGA